MPTKQPPIPVESNVPRVSSQFYPHEAINPELWDQYTPYQLVIVKVVPTTNGEMSYAATRWRFTLPISPQELSNGMSVATRLEATLTGVSIQHGGAPFRDINLQGTTGISPVKNRGEAMKQRDLGSAIFAGTVSAASLTKSATKKLDQGSDFSLNINQGLTTRNDDPDRILETSTGYYQMRLMEQFIESYIAIKTGSKTTELDPDLTTLNPKLLRLAFCMWKDEAVYLVEPLNFVKRRSSSSPMEYMFTLQLRAYKRVILNFGPPEVAAHEFVGRNPSAIAQIFNRFRAAREIITNMNDVLRSTINDPINLMEEALRETSLFLGEVSAIRSTLNNYPADVLDAAVEAVSSNWQKMRSQFSVSPELDRALAMGARLDASQRAEFDKKISTKLTPDALRLPATIRKKIQSENDRAKALTRADFEANRDLIIKTANDFAAKVGAGNEVFAETYGLGWNPVDRTPTDAEMDILFALNESAILFDHLAVSSNIDPQTPSSIEYVAGLAEQAGIAFKVPRSKQAVPFPYGSTLEQLALQYLGDANRWHEIAVLNGLRTPYVDEVGFSLPLLTNGNNNTIIVGDVSKFYQGQTVWVASNTVRKTKRHILRIETISPGYNVITLDGEAGLDAYTVDANAVVEAFLPGTVNSQQIIYIPSDVEAPEDPRTKAVPGVDAFDSLLEVGGIDLLLTPDGDLAITSDGDCRLAYGLTNIVQTVRLALSTPKGGLLQHPEYGLAVPVGTSTADIDANELLKAAREQFARDPMFSGVRTASVVKEGPVLKMTLDIGIAGTSQFVPITVAIR